ncbi:MAG: UDP-N-acetylglucosamine 1-carboxyvinyltransferase [Candidatus Edwardsbacteria bacterium]
MDKFVIQGGNRLEGRMKISGAKNSALPIMAASLLASGKSRICNIPNVMDVRTMKKMLSLLGAKVEFENNVLTIDASGSLNFVAPYELVKTMRASYYVLGPLLARLGQAKVSLPGGCAIGARPIDLHLKGMRELGAEIEVKYGYIEAKAKGLKGAAIFLEGPHGSSVGATINVMMAATLAQGKTVIEHAACEPEVADVAEYLNRMGARISGAGTPLLTIDGVKSLAGAEHTLIPDRIETATLMIASAITKGQIEIEDCFPEHCSAVIEKLQEAGIQIEIETKKIKITGREKRKPLEVIIAPYPGFPTDVQAQLMSLMTVTEGISVITETIFENRFMHVLELQRLGADIRIEGNSAIIKGIKSLSGAPVMASDLRASAALVLAGLVAEGKTEISRIYHLDRGYENFEKKLQALGARIERISVPE